MSRPKMVTNNKSFMQPMRRLSMHKTGDEMRSQDGKHCTEKRKKKKKTKQVFSLNLALMGMKLKKTSH